MLIACLPLLGGCSTIPRAGPGERAIDAKAADIEGFSLIEVTAANIGFYLVRHRGDTGGTADVQTSARVLLAPGDLLRVTIAESQPGGLFAPLATGGTIFNNVRVDQNGRVSLPYAGRVSVRGLEPFQVESRIRGAVTNVAFEPQVYVELLANRNNSVLVTGAVKVPGRFSVLDGPMTVIDAVNLAGGPELAPHQTDVVVRRGRKVARMSLATVLNGHNRPLQRGDEVVLEPNVKVFNALGAVTKTGQTEFSKLDPTLLDALSQVGGLSPTTASNTGVFVFRLHEDHAWQDEQGAWHAGPAIFKFDMSKPETLFLAGKFGIEPNDTIYVTTAPSIEWERALRPLAITLSTIKGSIDLATTNVTP